jgi:prevent-host-death family protein
MKTVSVSELKTHLSRYLREVRRGGEVQILDRGVPVARLSPLPAYPSGEDEEHRCRLIEAGVLRPGSGQALDVLDTEPLELPGGLLGALTEDREDRF